MDERLSRSNRLPGSEKLTRPEEIGQLSKYLKSIKEVYEESTRLENQVLGVSGYSTGKIPEVGELGKKIVRAPGNQKEVKLERKILGLDSSPRSQDESDGNGSGESGSSGHVVKRPDNEEETSGGTKKEVGLENKRLDLNDSRTTKLIDDSVKRPE